MIAVDVAPLPRPGWLDRGALLMLPSYVSRPTSIILLQSVSLLLCVCPLIVCNIRIAYLCNCRLTVEQSTLYYNPAEIRRISTCQQDHLVPDLRDFKFLDT